jgi:hypothetical protein
MRMLESNSRRARQSPPCSWPSALAPRFGSWPAHAKKGVYRYGSILKPTLKPVTFSSRVSMYVFGFAQGRLSVTGNPIHGGSLTPIRRGFAVDSQGFAVDSPGFAQDSRTIRADSRTIRAQFAQIRTAFAQIRTHSQSFTRIHGSAGIRGDSQDSPVDSQGFAVDSQGFAVDSQGFAHNSRTIRAQFAQIRADSRTIHNNTQCESV